MGAFFANDGPFIGALTKVGQLIILTLIWALCCIPIVTVIGSTSSFYYATIKSVRKEVSYPVREFFSNFKRTLKDGIVFNLILIVWVFLMYLNRDIAVTTEIGAIRILYIIYIALLILTFSWVSYLCPVLSRFEVPKIKMAKMALTMMFLQPLKTLVLTVVPAVLVWVCFFYLPVACVFAVPGFWIYAATYLIEPALRKFMPEPEENEQMWYY